jgi:autotransporter adhesin
MVMSPAPRYFTATRRTSRPLARLLCSTVSTIGVASAMLLGTQSASAQGVPNVVSACAGVSLPPSVVTDIIAPVVGGVVSPLQGSVNSLLGILTPLDIDVDGLLNDAAEGEPITLQVLNANGTVVGPADRCDLRADSFQLDTEGGLAIGGNRITGLGTNGAEAIAGEANSIAFGNSANTSAAALGAVAIGTRASVTAANSIALGTDSVAARGALANYGTLGITGTTSSVGEFSVGAAGATRQITNVAAGIAPTDAVNVAQLTGVAAQIGAVSANSVLYDTIAHDRITLTGATGTTIGNVAPGAVEAGSTEAVNGAQLFATNGNVTNNTNAITNLTTNVQNGSVGTVQYSNAATPTVPNGGIATNDLALVGATAAPVGLHNVAAGALGAGSTDAVNGAQLGATNDAVATNTTNIANVTTNVTALQADALLYDNTLQAYNAARGGISQQITNVAAGALSADSLDAVNGGQLFATNGNVTNNSNAIANLTTSVQNGAVGTVQYSNAATPTVPNGGIATNDLTLVGATAAPVGLHNVRAGVLAAGSTDAVNGAQLSATNDAVTVNTTNIANINTSVSGLQTDALLYDSTLQAYNASRGGVAQQITNVAAGLIGTNSLDAVNGAQLYGLGNSLALALGGSSSYDPGTGAVSAGISYGGTTYGSVQGAVSAIETSLGGMTPGTDLRYFNATSVMADSQAMGTDSTAIGPNAIASADGAIAAGRNTVAGSAGSVAIGDGSSTIDGRAVSIGFANIASGDGAVAIGDPNIALGDGAVALGRDNEATGIGAVALGDTNFATGNGSVSLGQTNQATGDGTIAIGTSNVVNGVGALAFGNRNQVTGDGSLAFGSDIVTGGVDTLAVGNASVATGDNAAAFGNGSVASGLNSSALGTLSLASGDFALAVGERSAAAGFGSTALGTLSSASAFASTALGAGAIANLENSVALGSASSTLRGGVANYTAFGVDGAQSSIGEIAVARSADYIDPATGVLAPLGTRQITGVAAGSEDNDAVNVAQLRGVSTTLGTAFVTSLGGGAAYDLVTGTITGPTYVINGATYTNVGDALAGVGGQINQVAVNSVSYDNAAQTSVTLGGAGGTTITNVAAGALTATSTDAVNGAQLNATNQAVAANTAAITNLGNTVTDLSTTVATLDASVTNVSTAVTNLGDDINNGAIGTVQYSNPGSPTTPNGGVPTNDLTLVGATAAPVGLHNVAAGSISAGSTDAVNGGQVFALAQASVNAVTYDADANGVRTNTVTLAGGNAAAPVTLANVAAGALNATSTQAVNGAQLFATNQNVATVQTTANTALTLSQNSVQYDASRTEVTFNNGGGAVTLHNVAAGTSATDAVNVSQLNTGINNAVTQANSYTDSRIAALDFDLRSARRDNYAGTSAALAAAGLPQAYEAGKGMIAIAGGTYQGQSAVAVGFSKAFDNGSTVVKFSGSYDSQGRAGASGGIGYQF